MRLTKATHIPLFIAALDRSLNAVYAHMIWETISDLFVEIECKMKTP